MAKKYKKPIRLLPAVLIAAIILATVIIWAGCKKQPAEQTHSQQSQNYEHPPSNPPIESPNEPAKTDVQPTANSKLNINDIIRAARYWRPAYTYWYGKTAPDFTVTDITGKQHKLSDHRGKNVMLIFWATWCRPCIMEVPHLIELRNTISEDKLAMLAISYITTWPPNTAEMVENFVKQNKSVNYTVIAVDSRAMPNPYKTIAGIPCSFFIDPQGKIKLATEGLLSLGEIKAILQAE